MSEYSDHVPGIEGIDLSMLGKMPQLKAAANVPYMRHYGPYTLNTSVPDETRYYGADGLISALDGSMLAGRLPGIGGFNVPATVVPRAKLWGGSRGYNPHDTSQIEVVVNPNTPEVTPFTLHLGHITPETSRRALQLVKESGGDFSSGDLGTQLAVAAAFQVMAELGKHVSPRVSNEHGRTISGGQMRFAPAKEDHSNGVSAPATVPVSVPVSAVPPPTSQPVMGFSDATLVPSEPQRVRADTAHQMPRRPYSFFNKPETPAPENAFTTPFAVSPEAAPRTLHAVTIDLGDFMVEGKYTTVIRKGAFGKTGVLILGIDLSMSGDKAIPKSKAPFALYQHMSREMLQVERTGVEFEHAGEMLYILEIKQAIEVAPTDGIPSTE